MVLPQARMDWWPWVCLKTSVSKIWTMVRWFCLLILPVYIFGRCLDPGISTRIVVSWLCPVVPSRWVWMVLRRSFVWWGGLRLNQHLLSKSLSFG